MTAELFFIRSQPMPTLCCGSLFLGSNPYIWLIGCTFVVQCKSHSRGVRVWPPKPREPCKQTWNISGIGQWFCIIYDLEWKSMDHVLEAFSAGSCYMFCSHKYLTNDFQTSLLKWSREVICQVSKRYGVTECHVRGWQSPKEFKKYFFFILHSNIRSF